MRRIVFFTFFLSLAACSTGPVPATSPYFRIPAGSKLILKQALTIPANAGRVYIQYGKVVSPKEKDDYHAHCWFLSWNVFEHAQLIKPDTFVITQSQQLEDTVSNEVTQQYAMNGFGHAEGGGPMALVYSTQMRIHSETQPAIRQFTCSHWENPYDAKHLTVAEMQKALGRIAHIQINTGR